MKKTRYIVVLYPLTIQNLKNQAFSSANSKKLRCYDCHLSCVVLYLVSVQRIRAMISLPRYIMKISMVI